MQQRRGFQHAVTSGFLINDVSHGAAMTLSLESPKKACIEQSKFCEVIAVSCILDWLHIHLWLRNWKPWAQSTGPNSEKGKATVSTNTYKGGVRDLLRQLARALRKSVKASDRV